MIAPGCLRWTYTVEQVVVTAPGSLSGGSGGTIGTGRCVELAPEAARATYELAQLSAPWGYGFVAGAAALLLPIGLVMLLRWFKSL